MCWVRGQWGVWYPVCGDGFWVLGGLQQFQTAPTDPADNAGTGERHNKVCSQPDRRRRPGRPGGSSSAAPACSLLTRLPGLLQILPPDICTGPGSGHRAETGTEIGGRQNKLQLTFLGRFFPADHNFQTSQILLNLSCPLSIPFSSKNVLGLKQLQIKTS